MRELEAELLRLSAIDLPIEMQDKKKLYDERLNQLEDSHSHSWFGDHASAYFQDFVSTPAGRSFDVEWGFLDGFNRRHNPGWRTYSRQEIRDFVFRDIGEDIFHNLQTLSQTLIDQFKIVRDQALDVLEAISNQIDSKALVRYSASIENELKPYAISDYINGRAKATPNMTRDSSEIAKGKNVPAHVQYQSSIQAIEINKRRLRDLASVIRNVIEAVELNSPREATQAVPHVIFIGHGRSEQWRALKDFLRDRLGLEFEEFNRISAAGINTQERLSEMLNKCGFAFLVLAGEDLHGDGSLHARENVIHEAGLFQGHLGWRKAIIVLEDGCAEFSNVAGLGQIRFPKENIAACFEEVRRVLEREEMVAK